MISPENFLTLLRNPLTTSSKISPLASSGLTFLKKRFQFPNNDLKKANLRELFEIQHTKHPRYIRMHLYLTANQYLTNVYQTPRFSIILNKTTCNLEKSPPPSLSGVMHLSGLKVPHSWKVQHYGARLIIPRHKIKQHNSAVASEDAPTPQLQKCSLDSKPIKNTSLQICFTGVEAPSPWRH